MPLRESLGPIRLASNRSLASAGLGLILLLAPGGCSLPFSQTCEEGVGHCVDAHTLEICVRTGDPLFATNRVAVSACGIRNPFCVTRTDTSSNEPWASFCAASAAPEPSCAGQGRAAGHCWQGSVISCVSGFPQRDWSCESQICAEATQSGRPSCAACVAPDAVTDDHCLTRTRLCHDNAVNVCDCSVRSVESTCAASEFCVEVAENVQLKSAFCALDANQSQDCPNLGDGDGTGNGGYCEGDNRVVCVLGYRVSREACANGCDATTGRCK